MNSLLDQKSKCNNIVKTNQELSKNNVKPFENKTIKQDWFIETTTTTNKESKKSGKKINYMKHHLKRKVKNVIVNKTQVSISGSNNNKLDKKKVINH